MDRILVVEDDRELNQGICFALQQAGYETEVLLHSGGKGFAGCS